MRITTDGIFMRSSSMESNRIRIGKTSPGDRIYLLSMPVMSTLVTVVR